MRKEKIIVGFSLFSVLAHAQPQSHHLKALLSKYPFGLLGDDFGLLSPKDLEANTCGFDPVPYPNDGPYPYWQCFETKKARFKCEYTGEDLSGSGPLALIVLQVNDSRGAQEFLSRRAIDLADCAAFRRDWHSITKGQKHVCISGSTGGNTKSGGKPARFWIFEKYKTRSGCDSYFQGFCDVNKMIREKCKPEFSKKSSSEDKTKRPQPVSAEAFCVGGAVAYFAR